jgi:hypothetical protein
MSKLVNYKKRSVALPAGAKNLVDVLKGGGATQPAPTVHHPATLPYDPSTVSRSETFSGGIPDLEKYVAMVFESRAFSFMLTVIPMNERIAFEAFRGADDVLSASVSVRFNTDLERAVRCWFVQRDIPVSEDSEMPPQFLPDQPVEVNYEISPVPSEASTLSKLAADFFREALSLTDESPLTFTFYETKVVE